MNGPANDPRFGAIEAPRISPPTRHSLLRGVLAFRWSSGLWMTAVFAWECWDRRGASRPGVDHPVAGFALLGLATAVTVLLTVLYRRDPDTLLGPKPIALEIAIASMLSLADMWVYGAEHAQALPTIWPVAVIFTVAIAGGTRPAVLTGLGLGAARYLGWLLELDDGDTPWSLARIASMVLFALAGWVAGYLLEQQAASDRSISAYRAREDVARTLHDGVLQTLAVIQRRSDDAQLVDLARTQELELRDYLFTGRDLTAGDSGDGGPADLAATLRHVARRVEQQHGQRIDVVCAPDLPVGSPDHNRRLGGAVSEALTNAAKHSGADLVRVYAEPDDGPSCVFVSVKDRGVGFDPEQQRRGQGLDRSITARITEAGGRVEVDGRPGRGVEVRLWL